ncbi:MAG: universal stress protein [Spirochaetia bacterium]
MLGKALVPLSLHEPVDEVSDLCEYIQSLGAQEVLLLHVGAEKGRAGKQNLKRLEKYEDAVKLKNFNICSEVQSGSVQMETMAAASEWEADFICIPFRKKTWLHRAVLGSKVKDIIRQSDIPVFVYKEPTRRQQKDGVFRVLYATSLQGRDEVIISHIRHKDFHVDEAAFLHVGTRAPDPKAEEKRREAVRESLATLEANCGLRQKQSQSILEIGTPRNVIVRTAKKLAADLVLLGKADNTKVSEPVLGSTAEEVSYNTPCSVMIIPKKKVDFTFQEETE